MSDLKALLSAARPMKRFVVEINGEMFDLQCRKASTAQTQAIQDEWNRAYEEELKKLEGDEDTSLIFATLKRQSKERLAEYVAKADRMDYLSEARIFYPDAKDNDDARVQTKADEMVAERQADLSSGSWSHTDVLEEAMKRRSHIQGLLAASSRATKITLFLTIYKEDGSKFFESMNDLEEFDDDTLDLIAKASVKAMEAPKESPLS